jgi:glycosyltransferase involved in cell wall biosynthesis
MKCQRKTEELKVDLAMWAKNGERYLPRTLKRIEKVVPRECINQKIFVDDSSVDGTVEIANEFGWTVYRNLEGFVSGGAREAFRHVETEIFCTFEQDVVLAEDWWSKILRHMEDPKVLTAQGVRVWANPMLRKLAEYEYGSEKTSFEEWRHSRFANMKGPRPFQGVTIDNNMFNTSILRELGGFPNRSPFSVDIELEEIAFQAQYKWIIDDSVISYHIRDGVKDMVRRDYNNVMMSGNDRFSGSGFMFRGLGGREVPFRSVFRSAITSPIRGMHIAFKTRMPNMFFIYPYIRLMTLKTFIHRPWR